ncbi:MAG: hypothetical protein A2805_00885 [Candidatus Andersenbacteria bacterium RIFCSPHIGHO2_01_FULL_46_36]|uniref:Uncharacterized protein n=1 Tax=Candidatus Andersenbacteria bacterium RIFCSPHIGHO2_12_FULL_45_11 TaxID=1797281 RepID=A0A1G1X0Y0_9BACT|nr:MAG: hypothetical protein A2805_00885 [Candidatus Andersenbacteria bacterium RIFCSPHIGHO2_01_FULL_46_36]OGY33633.1 MAG: hypothetical protein A3D99_03740 [Candidatus Andersenbacteria bacterium RIFCSPHIGHO2_12_FULL_45_11]
MSTKDTFRDCMNLGRAALVAESTKEIESAIAIVTQTLRSRQVVGQRATSLRGMRRSLEQALIAAIRIEPDRIFAEIMEYLDRVQSIAAYKSKVNERRILRMQRYLDCVDDLLRRFGALQLTFDQLELLRPKIQNVESTKALAIRSLSILQRRFSRERRIGA